MEEVNPRAHDHPAVARTLGLRFTHLSRERVAAELPARAELANRKNVLSGGVLMALADILGGTAASDGTLVALVTQTQLVMPGRG
jgi:1,4-dihydroxy-2-naphthoyl-CoA hydrolase